MPPLPPPLLPPKDQFVVTPVTFLQTSQNIFTVLLAPYHQNTVRGNYLLSEQKTGLDEQVHSETLCVSTNNELDSSVPLQNTVATQLKQYCRKVHQFSVPLLLFNIDHEESFNNRVAEAAVAVANHSCFSASSWKSDYTTLYEFIPTTTTASLFH